VLSMPALVVGNAEDPVHPLGMAAELARRLPDARLAIVASKDAGEERHRTEVAEAIDALLDELGVA
jgi:pimeloyl-ACP methyl ester carboxylesterase